MASRAFAALVTVIFVVCSSVPHVLGSHAGPLQDFCVADKLSAGIYTVLIWLLFAN